MARTARVKQQTQRLAVGLALLALSTGFLLFIIQNNRPHGVKMLEKALTQLEQRENYNLSIIEKAARYKLSFQGSVENRDQLKGILPDYNLEVLFQDGRLRLRQEKTDRWVKADSLGLHGLSGFLMTPLELLQGRADCFPRVHLGDKITLGQSSCQTLYFTVDNPEKLLRSLFPEIDYAGVSEVTIGAALAEPDLTLKQLRVMVEFDSPNGEQIERSYHLDH